MTEAQDRIISTLRRLTATHEGQTIAVFSHSDMIKAVLMYYLGLSLDRILSFEIGPASISMLQVDPGGDGIISSINCIPA
jgi:broad specificity phosphatase PhoE